MGMRAKVGFVLVALLVAPACGGGGDDEQAAGDDVEVAAGPVVDLDPCDLLDDGAAATLTGGDVEHVDIDPIATLIGCTYRPADEDGSAIAATLVMGERTFEPQEAADRGLGPIADEPDAQPVPVELLDLDVDAVAGVTDDETISLSYVVEEVVVVLQVSPVGGVDDASTEAAIEFLDSTVEPVTRSFEAKQREEREADEADGDEDGDAVQQEEIAGLWTGDWGTMAIEVDGTEVRAAYTHDDGRITGTFEDGVFRGRWTEIPSREGPSDAGEVEFRFAKTDDDTIALDGRWDYDGDEEPLGHEDWDLTLSADEVPPELLEAFEDEASFDQP